MWHPPSQHHPGASGPHSGQYVPGGVGAPGSAMPPRKPNGKRRAGTVLLIIGAVIGVIALAVGVWAAVGFRDGLAKVDDGRVNLSNGSVRVQLIEGDERMLWGEGARLSNCRVSGPGGQMAIQHTDVTVTVNSSKYFGSYRFTADQSGTYQVNCSGEGFVGESITVGGVAGVALGIVVAIMAGLLAGLLLLIGLILFLVGRKN